MKSNIRNTIIKLNSCCITTRGEPLSQLSFRRHVSTNTKADWLKKFQDNGIESPDVSVRELEKYVDNNIACVKKLICYTDYNLARWHQMEIFFFYLLPFF